MRDKVYLHLCTLKSATHQVLYLSPNDVGIYATVGRRQVEKDPISRMHKGLHGTVELSDILRIKQLW